MKAKWMAWVLLFLMLGVAGAQQSNVSGATNVTSIITSNVFEQFDTTTNGVAVSETIDQTKAKAEKGDAAAQLKLGSCYSVGAGIPQNYGEAFKWFLKSAEQGVAEAQLQLGICYGTGQGVATNHVEAVKWYRKAAEQGFPFAELLLGLAYEHGNGVSQDYVQAASWYRKAAEQGNVFGMSMLASCYKEGTGVAKDEAEAAEWLRKATSNKEQMPQVAFMARGNAESGDAGAQNGLGVLYYFGRGVPQDYAVAVQWFRKAAEQGHANAQTYLGRCYANGYGLLKDEGEAVKWYRKAAEQGEVEAQILLGLAYAQTFLGTSFDSLGLRQDYGQAAKWFMRAAAQGDAVGQSALGDCYKDGLGVPKNRVEAYKWFNLASAQSAEGAKKDIVVGSAEARDSLGHRMSGDEIAEAERLAAAFVPRKEKSDSGSLTSSQNPSVSGTGFFISEDGFLVTNAHVVRDAAQFRLVTSAGLISAKVVKVDAANDLALLKAEGRFVALPVAASRGVKLGGTVATVGFPNIGLQGFAPKLAKGEIASLSGAGDDARYFQISVPVQPGNSGGALVDERGNVVGVVSAKLNASAALASSGSLPENVNYAVKSSYLLSFLESIPDVSAKLKEPDTKEKKFEEVVKAAEQAAVLVLVY